MESGTRLGPYVLDSPLGVGGMGEVYRACDTRLNRDVAVKVLAPGRLTDPTARAHFEREMAIAAQLAHPRICTVYDAGAEGDRGYLAMELLRGETLATRLDRTRGQGLVPQEALDIAVGVCEALACAHRHGVVHGDVKPSNIMLTADGVKLLDFGVARLHTPESTADASAGTAPLPFVGTPAYMAPEQLNGRADQRTDLFAVGAVLYEMLSGRKAFPGDTTADTLGALTHCAPAPLSDSRPGLSTAITRIVSRCLHRNADERWQSAADLAEALRWVQGPDRPPARSVRATAWSSRQRWLAIGTLALGIAALALGRDTATLPPAEFYVDDIPLPDGERFLTGQSSWTRDGRRVALVTVPLAGNTSGSKLWIRDVGRSSDWRLVDGARSEFVTYPSWSPDGQSLTYFRDRVLVRRSLSSAAPVMLTDAPDGRGTTWLNAETILFAPEAQGDIWRIPANGGAPDVIARRQSGDLGVKFPVALTDGQFLFWAQRSDQAASEVRVTSATAPETSRTVAQSAKAGAYADGHLFVVQNNILLAQPLDARTWTVRGPAQPLPVELGMGGHIGAPVLTTGGYVAGVESVRRQTRELTWVDRTGRPLGTVGEVAPYRTMALSPDGERLVVEQAAPGLDTAAMWLLDLRTGGSRRLATEVGAMLPVWHPDRDRVAFRASVGPGGSGAVIEQPLDGQPSRALVEELASARPAGWTPQGDLVWWSGDATGRFNGIFVSNAQQAVRPYRTILVGAEARTVVVRPGGSAIAYTSNESGAFEVYVDTFPTRRSAPWKITTGGGSRPKWSPDGRELFFEAGGSLHVVAMTGAAGGPSGAPRHLFAFDGGDYDVHPDGRLLVQRRRRPEAYYLRVFRHWSSRPTGETAESRD